MTRPVWRPHQVRDQVDTVTVQQRVYTNFRTLQPPVPQGPGQGLPTFAACTFHWPTSAGNLASGASDRQTVRWQCSIIAAVIDVTTFGGAFTLQVLLNGVLIPGLSCAVTGAGVGQRFICNPTPMIPYVDFLTVNATVPGSNNKGIFLHAEAV